MSDLRKESEYGDIPKCRVTNRKAWKNVSDDTLMEVFKKAQKNLSYDALQIDDAVKAKYAEIVGGKAAFDKLAKEGSTYKWTEAFAGAEALRIGAIPSLAITDRSTVESDAADLYDQKGRPYDVKTFTPWNVINFNWTTTVKERLEYGTYPGAKGGRYPAVLIFDTGFMGKATLEAHQGKIAQSLDAWKSSWRIIEVFVDWTGAGFADYRIEQR
jgi:hypothetical protein